MADREPRMALYVLAFTDSAIRDAALQIVEIDGIFAVCWRRGAVPEATDETLRRQHQAVLEIARRASAILPVRFGALIGKDELLERMRSHEEVLRRALDEVRNRVQMTMRVLGTAPRPEPVHVSSGRQYLEERRRALDPVLPSGAQAIVEAVRPLTIRERLEPGAAGMLATIYHLIPATDASAYTAAAASMSSSNVIVSGPWPPFAFTPQLW